MNEARLKAGFISEFPNFLYWAEPLPEPIVFGFSGEGQIYEDFLGVVGESVETRIVGPESVLDGVSVLFVRKQDMELWAKKLEEIGAHALLLVSDQNGFVEHGGHIEFVIRKNRLRFRLNTKALEEDGIGVSAKLARLAVVD